jgi:F0F1-type ATP synthase membrane subunit b/b'
MGQDPDAIRQDIEHTRAEMTDTVEAIGYKADVPARAKEKVSEKVDAAKAKVSQATTRAKEAVAGSTSRAGDTAARVGDAAPSGDQVKHTARRAAGLAQENPLGLAIGAAAIGFLAGLVVPSTRVEDERLGPVADQVKDTVKETGQEALERGKQVAQEAVSSAAETARQRGQQQGQDLADSAKQRAQEVREEAREQVR